MKNDLHVALGITGGIAAYKACEIVSRLKKAGCAVRCVMTQNATKFIAPLTLETLSGNRVHVDGFDYAWEIEHISLAKWADVLLVAPATANILAKARMGIADDLLSTVLAAARTPVVFAPAMNTAMWKNPANLENVSVLSERGYSFIGPESGILACGDEDIGRMSEPEKIVEQLFSLLREKDFAGRRVLVTAGPTREMIDPVRFLSNRSTGRMGIALAEAARDRGAEVVLALGPVSIPKPSGMTIVDIVSTQDLYDTVTHLAKTHDIVIQAAAPADFTPESISPVKIKKTGGDTALCLKATPDIAKAIGEAKRKGQILVAFAAETNDLSENARKKLLKKNADLVVANDVTQSGAGFQGDTNIVTLIDADGEEQLPLLSKRETADRILDKIARIMGAEEHRCDMRT